MAKRLYYGRILAHMTFNEYMEKPYLHKVYDGMRLEGIYYGNTPDEIIDQLKADGYQIWGNKPLDYADYPNTALDYILQKSYLIHEYGMSEAEAHKALTLSKDIGSEEPDDTIA